VLFLCCVFLRWGLTNYLPGTGLEPPSS
jgi:hypothetical protein